VFQGCSDVVESRVEQAILDAESRRNAASTSDSEQPRRASHWGDARTSDNDSPRRAGLSIDELGDLSIDRDQREKVRSGELEQLPESKTKINHPVAMLQFRSLPSINEPAGDAAPSPLRFGKNIHNRSLPAFANSRCIERTRQDRLQLNAGAANDHFRFMQELRPSRCRRRSRTIPSAANALSRAEFQRRHRKGRAMS
jgi:hypothetical protein